MANLKFSVLMSIYYKENPEWFKTALESVVNQTLLPNEIVLVEDGQLTKELYEIISYYQENYSNLFKRVPLEKNVGLGNALKIGVENCTYDYIARMDTDDICDLTRFEKQIKYLEEHYDIDVLGTRVTEFKTSPTEISSYRNLPLSAADVLKYSYFRNPLAHMSVIFKKQSVLAVGNYIEIKFMEDYYLWGRLLNQKYKIVNLPDYLVNVRASDEMFTRRSNVSYFINGEYLLQKKFLEMNFITKFQFFRNVFLKFILRILPIEILLFIYKKFLRNSKGIN